MLGFYSQKHLERQERGVKKAFYPQYVLSQMTLEEELKQMTTSASGAGKKKEDAELFTENKAKSGGSTVTAK